MEDVASKLGLGIATVSRALSGASGVSEKTRRRVRDAAAELGYVVSPEASRLAGGSTRRIAVVVPHLSRWFFAEMLDGLGESLAAAGYDVLLYQVPDAAARHRFFADLPARRKVDAVVVVAFPVNEAEQLRLELLGVEIVAAGGQSADYPFVRIDDAVASRQAVDHLLALGHRRIAMIEAVDLDSPEWHTHLVRSEGYYAALDEAGVEADPELVVRVPWSGEAGAEAMSRLISLRRPPTAVYAHSDEIAFGAMRTLRRAGLRVPQDVSVIGIDDHPISALLDLTTIHQSVREQGSEAAKMLLGILGGADPSREVVSPTHLVPRGSTARPAGAPDL